MMRLMFFIVYRGAEQAARILFFTYYWGIECKRGVPWKISNTPILKINRTILNKIEFGIKTFILTYS